MTLAVRNNIATHDAAAAYSMHSQLVPTFLTAEVAQAAQEGQLSRVCKWLNEGGPVDARDVFQFSLLHLAAGAGQIYIVRELIKRGAKLDERLPDALYAQGRTALHRACEEGHIEVVEALVAAGANAQLCAATCTLPKQAKPGRRCRMALCHQPSASAAAASVKSASELCKSNVVRLALEQPSWSPANHAMWPSRFKAAVQLLLFILAKHKHSNKENESVVQYCPFSSFSLTRRTSKATSKSTEANKQSANALQLDWDTLQEVIARLAYPVSQWCDVPKPVDVATPNKSSRKRRP